MYVAIDTNGLYTAHAGVARYTRGLLTGLREIASPDLSFFELAWPVENFSYRQPMRAAKTLYREFVWAQFSAPRIVSREQTELLHATSGLNFNTGNSVKRVATLYDLAILRHPERFRKWHRYRAGHHLEYISRADRVICISKFTADEAMKLLSLPADRLEITYCGCSFDPDHSDHPAEKPSFDVPAEFFLFVGSLEPGKNLALIRDVYQLAEKQGTALPPLLIVGARWKGVAGEGTAPANWIYLDSQPDSVLAHLYSSAIALLFPSKYEGFGLPVLEAMTLNCPVICSPVASLPEVGGEAVLFADQTPEAYLDGMKKMHSDSGMRHDLIQAGKLQAKKFSWKQCAEKTAGIYRNVLK